jgi:hypothetical protein
MKTVQTCAEARLCLERRVKGILCSCLIDPEMRPINRAAPHDTTLTRGLRRSDTGLDADLSASQCRGATRWSRLASRIRMRMSNPSTLQRSACAESADKRESVNIPLHNSSRRAARAAVRSSRYTGQIGVVDYSPVRQHYVQCTVLARSCNRCPLCVFFRAVIQFRLFEPAPNGHQVCVLQGTRTKARRRTYGRLPTFHLNSPQPNTFPSDRVRTPVMKVIASSLIQYCAPARLAFV